MAEFYEKRKLKKLMYSPPVLAVFTLFVLLFVSAAWGAHQKERDTASKRQEAAAGLAELQAREAALRSNLDRLNSESGMESEIRDRFDVGKPGEHEIVIVDPPANASSTTTETSKHWWEKLLSWF